MILQDVCSGKPRVSHYPHVLRTFVPKVKAATVKLVRVRVFQRGVTSSPR